MGTIAAFDLTPYIEEYGLVNFVETGTLWGDGVSHATKYNFGNIVSFEIESTIHEKAKIRFQDNSDVKIILGDSGTCLKLWEDLYPYNTLFFLDAHFPGADVGLADYDSEKNLDINLPLKKELEYIASRKTQDVIIIDDLRLFEDFADRVKLNDHLQRIGKGHLNRSKLVHFDIFELIAKLFPNKVVEKNYSDEGYIIIHE